MDVFSPLIYMVLLKVRDNDKLRNATISTSIHYDVYTSGDIKNIHETERMQMKYLTSDVLLQLLEEGERHEEGNRLITEDVCSGISDEIRKQQWVTWKEWSNQEKTNLLNDRHNANHPQEVMPLI